MSKPCPEKKYQAKPSTAHAQPSQTESQAMPNPGNAHSFYAQTSRCPGQPMQWPAHDLPTLIPEYAPDSPCPGRHIHILDHAKTSQGQLRPRLAQVSQGQCLPRPRPVPGQPRTRSAQVKPCPSQNRFRPAQTQARPGPRQSRPTHSSTGPGQPRPTPCPSHRMESPAMSRPAH
jgi:hypothetical protein